MELRQYTREDIEGKRVLLRCDLDVKVNNKGIVDQYHDLRLERIVPTLNELFFFGAMQIILLGHRGRPGKEPNDGFSLSPVCDRLNDLCAADGLDSTITFIEDIDIDPNSHSDDPILMLENLRFWPGEKNQDKSFAKKLSQWGDVYVNDAFGGSHRKDSSMTIITQLISDSFAGTELYKEISSLGSFLDSINNPFVAVLGGAKIATKLPLLDILSKKADCILLGGALANTVLASRGKNMGNSLIEESMIDQAKKLNPEKFIVPIDAVVDSKKIVLADKIGDKESMLDIGPNTIKKFVQHMKDANTILWNGPMGKFENKEFSKGTFEIALAVSKNKKARTLAGGGETVEVVEQLGLVDEFDFVSTGGGAMLTFLAGGNMPGVDSVSK
ncbi:phosphoglycerate kinase [bacterium]|jgi:phosphoglycerate kinase|nr:phosphoglycerate kinase [bacterium]MDP6756549.1 phosphoglycerate kinase [Patescibacteria group bacterium]|tara:strand:+ start:5155 stop:6312 length:1158 start_codon:yes stop_codon:yes gene_type:complete